MPLDLPLFDNDQLRRLVACGWLSTDDPAVIDRVAKLEGRKIAAVSHSINPLWMRLLIGRSERKPSKHVHLELALAAGFVKEPKADSSEKEIFDRISEFFGANAVITIWAKYVIRWDELPKRGLIRSLQVTATFPGATIEQTASTLRIRGDGPLQGLEWTRSDDGPDGKQMTDITLQLSVSNMEIAPNYMKEVYGMADRAWRQIVLEKDSGEETQK